MLGFLGARWLRGIQGSTTEYYKILEFHQARCSVAMQTFIYSLCFSDVGPYSCLFKVHRQELVQVNFSRK